MMDTDLLRKFRESEGEQDFNETDYTEDEENTEDEPHFSEYANSRLSYNARCKEDWMDPNGDGTSQMNNGECDIMWVSQDDINQYDFRTLLDCFGEFYKNEVAHKTYTVVMKSRSYPGSGSYMKKKVTYNNEGKWIEESVGDKLVEWGDLQLTLSFNYKNDNEVDVEFALGCPDYDIWGYGKTIRTAEVDLRDTFDSLEQYLDLEPDMEVTDLIIDYQTDIPKDKLAIEVYNELPEHQRNEDTILGRGSYKEYAAHSDY